MAGSNRAQRRAEARKAQDEGVSAGITVQEVEIPLAQPDRSGPKDKTLLEIAAEKRRELMEKHPEAFHSSNNGPNGASSPSDLGAKQIFDDDSQVERDGDWEFMSSEPLGAFGDALIYSISLGMLHFTLDVLVYSQYAQEIHFVEIFYHLLTFMPALFLVVYLTHTKTALRLKLMRQVMFAAVAVASGCWLVKAGNEDGYFLVMQKAPPLGCVWIWSVIESELYWAVGSVAAVALYTWTHGYTTF